MASGSQRKRETIDQQKMPSGSRLYPIEPLYPDYESAIDDQQKMPSGSGRYPIEPLYPYYESAIDRNPMICDPVETINELIPPNPRPHDNWRYAPWVPTPGHPVPWPNHYYFPHVVKGGQVLREPFPGTHRSPNDLRLPENKGHLAVALTLRGGVLLAVNHQATDSDATKLIVSLGPNIIATISGGDYLDCLGLLRVLQSRGIDYIQARGEISFEVALHLMTITLSSRPEVGLIAGWDVTSGCPSLYRVDGFEGLMKGEILAIGSGFIALYGGLDLNDMFTLKGYNSPLESWLKGVLHKSPQFKNYGSWSLWSVDEAVKVVLREMCSVLSIADEYRDLISVSFVGRYGLKHVHSDEPVEQVKQTLGIVIPKRNWKWGGTPLKRPPHMPGVPLPPFLEQYMGPYERRMYRFEQTGILEEDVPLEEQRS